jgi:hypothetical protein
MKKNLKKSSFGDLSKFDKMTLNQLSSIQGGVAAESVTSGDTTLSKDDSDHNSQDDDRDPPPVIIILP